MRKITELFANKPRTESSPMEHITPCVVSKDTIENILDSFFDGCKRMQHVQYDPRSDFSVKGGDGAQLLNFGYATPDNKPIFFRVTPFVLYNIVKQPTVSGKINIPEHELKMQLNDTVQQVGAERNSYWEWRKNAEEQLDKVVRAFEAAVTITHPQEREINGPNYFVDLFRKVQEVLTVTYTVNLAGLVRAASRAEEEICFHEARGFSDPKGARELFAGIANNEVLARQDVWTGTNLDEKIVGELRYQGFVAGYYAPKPEAQKPEEKKEEQINNV